MFARKPLTRRFQRQSPPLRRRRLFASVAGVAAIVVAVLALSPGPAGALGCTDSWHVAASGSWNTPADWSTGVVPASTDNVCLPALASSYTVTLNTSVSVNSITIGATSGATNQTLSVASVPGNNPTLTLATASTVDQTGALDLDSAGGGTTELAGAGTVTNAGSLVAEGTGPVDLDTNLINDSGATVEVDTPGAVQNTATTTTNDGTFTVDAGGQFELTNSSASFVNDAAAPGGVVNNGTITLIGIWTQNGPQSGHPVNLQSTATLTDQSGAGTFILIDTPILQGTIPAGQEVFVTGPSGHNGDAQLSGTVVNDGSLILDSPAGGGYAELTAAAGGGTLTNDSTLQTQVETGGTLTHLEVNLTNSATGTVEVKSGELAQDTATTTTNHGTLITDAATMTTAAGTLNLTNGSAKLINDGTLTNNGAINLTGNASWTQNAQTAPQTGNPVTIFNTGTLTDTSGTGSFTLIDTPFLTGTIPAGQTVTVTAPSGHNGDAQLTSTVVNNGTLVLDAPNNGGYAEITGASLTNNGTLRTQVEGAGPDYLDSSLTNAASGRVEAKSGTLTQNDATHTTNDGTFTVDAGATFDVTNGGALFVNQAAAPGGVVNNGTITLTGNASWTQNGPESGNAVSIFNTGLLTDQNGSGAFTLIDTPVLAGTIPNGQTVTVTAPSGHNGNAQLSGTVINDGTLVLDAPSGGGYAEVNGGALTNNGTLRTQVEGGGPDYLGSTLTNAAAGTVEIKTGTLNQNVASTTTNDGTFIVDAGATLDLTNGGALFVNNAAAPDGVVDSGAISLTANASWTQNGPESGNAVTIFNTGTLTDQSGTGSFTLIDTPILKGTIPTGQTVTVTAPSGHNADAQISGTVVNDGTLTLDSPSGGGYAKLTAYTGASTVTNNGVVQAQVETGGTLNYLEVNLTNSATGTLAVNSGQLAQDTATTTTNDGTLITDPATMTTAAGTLDLTNANALLVNDGTLTNNGAITLTANASWTQNAQTAPQTGNPVTIFNTGTLTDQSGTGSFTLIDTPILTGTVPAGQTVTVTAPSGHNADAQISGTVVNDGTLTLDSPSGGGYAKLTAYTGASTVTNNGVVQAQVETGGTLNYLEVNLTNSATGTLAVNSGQLAQDTATTTTNDGTLITDPATMTTAAGTLDLTNANALLVNDGTLTNNGAITLTANASWTQNAQTAPQTGNPVTIFNTGTLTDQSGTGSFTLIDTPILTGTVPVGQTVTVTAPSGHNADAQISGTVVNDGTLTLDSPSGGGYAKLTAYTGGSTVTNNGVVQAQVETGGTLNYLEVNLTNSATGTLEVNSGQLAQDTATTTTNDGTITVSPGANYAVTNGSATLANAAAGTLAFGLASTSPSGIGTLSFSGGATLQPGGTVEGVLSGGTHRR